MLRGVDRHCADCGTVTIFLPLDDPGFEDDGFDDAWICTACDGAVVIGLRTLAA